MSDGAILPNEIPDWTLVTIKEAEYFAGQMSGYARVRFEEVPNIGFFNPREARILWARKNGSLDPPPGLDTSWMIGIKLLIKTKRIEHTPGTLYYGVMHKWPDQ